MIPQASHAKSVRPTEPVPSATPTGEINIPEPEIKVDSLLINGRKPKELWALLAI